jgi:hypothetical protein
MSFPVDPRDDTVQADPERLNVPRRRPPVDGVNYNPAFVALYDLPTSPEALYGDAPGEADNWAHDLTGYTGTSYLASPPRCASTASSTTAAPWAAPTATAQA